MFLTDDEVLMG